MPTPKELAAYGERWHPYRTVASWYLWRASEQLSPKKAKTARRSSAAANKKRKPKTFAR